MPKSTLLQAFLSSRGHGVFEVCTLDDGYACTCPGFSLRKTCKHIDYVIERTDEDGSYVTALADGALDALHTAIEDHDQWRAFVLRYTIPAVL